MLSRRIEEVALNAWPALQQVLLDGWILRFSRGYTKRANSVNALYPSEMNVRTKIDICEEHYRERGQSVVFRLTPFCFPTGLDEVLAGRGYERIHPTMVMHLDLSRARVATPVPGDLRCQSLDDWMSSYCRMRGEPLSFHQTHRELLGMVPGSRYPVSLLSDGQVVSCGLGVLERSYLGLFDIITHPEKRNMGYGTALICGILEWAQGLGARHAYLQVMMNNAPAQHVYHRLGFQDLYPYWYRVRT